VPHPSDAKSTHFAQNDNARVAVLELNYFILRALLKGQRSTPNCDSIKLSVEASFETNDVSFL